jgi:hypothetical protein
LYRIKRAGNKDPEKDINKYKNKVIEHEGSYPYNNTFIEGFGQ